MLWFFDRDNESLRLETRYDNETLEFVAVVRYADGRDLERRFRQRGEFGNGARRSKELSKASEG